MHAKTNLIGVIFLSILSIAVFANFSAGRAANSATGEGPAVVEHETGFFWGAMYISYAFSTAFMIIFGIIAINNDWSWNKIVWTILISAIVLVPFSYRYSRILLLYFISPNRRHDSKYRLGDLKDTGLNS